MNKGESKALFIFLKYFRINNYEYIVQMWWCINHSFLSDIPKSCLTNSWLASLNTILAISRKITHFNGSDHEGVIWRVRQELCDEGVSLREKVKVKVVWRSNRGFSTKKFKKNHRHVFEVAESESEVGFTWKGQGQGRLKVKSWIFDQKIWKKSRTCIWGRWIQIRSTFNC